MAHRSLSVSLVILTLVFFWQAYLNKTIPKIFPQSNLEQSIALNEFFLLFEEDHRTHIDEVLKQFNVQIIKPMGEWLHVGTKESLSEQTIVSLTTEAAQMNKMMIAKLEAHPAIHTAHLNYIEPDDGACRLCLTEESPPLQQTFIVPKDPLYKEQWHLSAKKGVRLPEAWAITKGSAKNVIAVVDRNFSLMAPDVNPVLCKSRQYYYENVLDYTPQKRSIAENDKYSHGLGVLNVLAPCTDNGFGLAGIDWYAQIFAVDTKGDRTLSGRMFGVMWAAGLDVCTAGIASCPAGTSFQKNHHPADIINASFGFSGSFLDDPPYGPVLDMLGTINRQGRIVVASAGNEGANADKRLPGAAGGVISVGASTIDGKSPAFANFGRTIDILAPGEDILALMEGGMVALDGTSFATPIVSGIVSLMLSVNQDLSWKHAEYILKKTARPISCENYCPSAMSESVQSECKKLCCEGAASICSAGIVDAFSAVAMAKEGIPKTPLIDVDDYYVPLSKDRDFKAMLSVKNWGDAPAMVKLKKTNEVLKIYPEEFFLPPFKNGLPSSKEVLVYYEAIAARPLVMSLILEVQSSSVKIKADSIEAIVEIVPDESGILTNRK